MPPFDALLGLWRGTTTLKSPSSDPKLAKSGHGNGKAGRSSEVGVGGIGLGADGVGVGVGSERAGAAKGGAAAKAGSGAPPSEGSEAQQTSASGKGSSGKSVGKAPQSKGRGKGSKGSAKPALECWYKGCFRPKESSQFYVIEEGRQSGKQDWTPLVGKTLCAACYCRYKDRGTLDRAVNIPLPKSAKRCTNKACEKPEDSTCFFKIEAGRKSGGRDWSSLEGEVLCAACYERYRSRGTLERHKNKPLDRSRRRCTYSRCDRPDHGEKFFLIEEGRSSGGKDWSSVVGQVLCHTCYERFRTRGTLERAGNGTTSKRTSTAAAASIAEAAAPSNHGGESEATRMQDESETHRACPEGGAVSAQQEGGAVSAQQEGGAVSAQQEGGAVSAQQEPRRDVGPANTAVDKDAKVKAWLAGPNSSIEAPGGLKDKAQCANAGVGVGAVSDSNHPPVGGVKVQGENTGAASHPSNPPLGNDKAKSEGAHADKLDCSEMGGGLKLGEGAMTNLSSVEQRAAGNANRAGAEPGKSKNLVAGAFKVPVGVKRKIGDQGSSAGASSSSEKVGAKRQAVDEGAKNAAAVIKDAVKGARRKLSSTTSPPGG